MEAHYAQSWAKLKPGFLQAYPHGTKPRVYPSAPKIKAFTIDFEPGFDVGSNERVFMETPSNKENPFDHGHDEYHEYHKLSEFLFDLEHSLPKHISKPTDRPGISEPVPSLSPASRHSRRESVAPSESETYETADERSLSRAPRTRAEHLHEVSQGRSNKRGRSRTKRTP